MNVYKELIGLGVFALDDVEKLYNNRNSAVSAIRSMLKKGLATSIRKNLFVFNNIETRAPVCDKYKIGSSINKSAYISHHSAFEFYGLSNQVFFELTVSSNTHFRSFEFEGITYKYNDSSFENGVETYTTNRGVKVTNIERTVIDCIKDIDKSGGIEEVLQCLRLITFLDEEKLIEYLDCYNIQFVYQKAGFLLEYFKEQLKLSDNFITYCHNKIITSKRYMGDKDGQEYNARWRLFTPRRLFKFLEQGGSELV